MSERRPPVVVIGMHRSGTGLVTRMLEQMGVFPGADLEANHESRFFMGRNEEMLRRVGATWDEPFAVDGLLADPGAREQATFRLARAVNGSGVVRYLGPRRYLRGRGLGRLDEAWGWKDPRTTFTLPLWLDVFPAARVVHVVRHGVDVAASMVERDLRWGASRRHQVRRVRRASSPNRGAGLDAALALWERYVERGREHVAMLGKRAVEVRFERLLCNPELELAVLAAACAIDPGRQQMEAAAALADAGRALSHRSDTDLTEFAAANHDRLVVHGYD